MEPLSYFRGRDILAVFFCQNGVAFADGFGGSNERSCSIEKNSFDSHKRRTGHKPIGIRELFSQLLPNAC
jgi:hypothetical protein